jgi:tryptophan 7-halogenase
MKVAVIGGGTAGHMAAAHLTKYFPSIDLYHIYNSRIPPIGVGEGTTPPFLKWIDEITGLSFAELQERCDVTHKYGIRFENWGKKHRQYSHYFSPIEEATYHISAAKLVKLLREYITATFFDRHVIDVQSNGTTVKIIFADDTPLEVDFAFDARGFPKVLDETHLNLSCIPTNAAVIRRGATVDFQTATRAVARPYGWIFIIPLTTYTSYGYIYNSTIDSKSKIEMDFDRFLQVEKVEVLEPDKSLRFPNFARYTFFDGAQFHIGNVASFLEPLEATAISIIILQLRLASFWLLDNLLGLTKQQRSDERSLKAFNEYLLDFIQKAALFVSWHYAQGSCFDTQFWRFAKLRFEQWLESLANREISREFKRYVQAGSQLPEALAFVSHLQDFDGIALPGTLTGTFGGFLDQSFAKVGYGIGYYPQHIMK